MIQLISAMYEETEAQVRTNDGMSDLFDINAGVLQGDALAPFLFIWVVDYILRKAVRETGIEYTLVNSNGRRHPAMKISELASQMT